MLAVSSCGLKKEKISAPSPVKVEVLSVDESTATNSRTYSGTLVAGKGSSLSFAVAGTVKNVYVDVGQKVAQGQLLAELDSDNLANSAAIARAALSEAEDAYQRYKQLHDANALADIKWVEVENTLKQAQSAAAIANRALNDTKLHAPFGGVVAERHIDVGQNAVPAVPVLQIVALNNIKASIAVPETEISAMHPGSRATVTIDALSNKPIDATLSEVGIVANPLTRTFSVEFTLDTPQKDLRPGMLCDVTVTTDTLTSPSIVLPAQAVLLSADNRNFVWLAHNGKAELRFVTPETITARGIAISEGLTSGDTVIIAGMQKVSNGTAIEY